ncbi:response regulator transcription factor [Inquilinus sp. CA228]|uniref:response regulator transcription factor n=1 Tax=Inquilinus sp. CA228 TaxID=3455609 RepID=UPI003F8D7868
MADGMTSGEIASLVAQVYDAALGDEDWAAVVERLSRGLGGACATLHRSALPLLPDKAARFNVDPTYGELFASYYYGTLPLMPKLMRLGRQTLFNYSTLMPEEDFLRTEYYNDYLRPQDKYGSINWVDADHRGPHAQLAIWRPRHWPSWDESQFRVMRAIGPHLGRAIEIERRLEAITVRNTVAGDVGLLAPQERACLAGVAHGASSKRIARALGLSMHTVNAYLASAKRKLKAASRSEAVAMALSAGLIDG